MRNNKSINWKEKNSSPKVIYPLASQLLRWLGTLLLLLLITCAQQLIVPGQGTKIVVLPDTQYYSQSHPDIFECQTQWIVDNRGNIDFVIHLGDVVQSYDKINEWENARKAMSKLNGKVRYMIIPGNHDGVDINMDNYKKYISSKVYDYAIVDNLLIVGFQWNPTPLMLQWADNVLHRHSYISAVVFTHEYLDKNGQRSEMGEKIWQELISKHDNIILVLNGHFRNFSGNIYKIDTLGGHPVYQCLSNYQHLDNGGDGWLRIYTINDEQIDVQAYSPYLKQYKQDECFALRR